MATKRTKRSASCSLPEAMIGEILVRLPTKDLLSCRAVCKAWRRLATDRRILLDHHSRQPPQPLFTMLIDNDDERYYINRLEAVDLGADKSRTIVRFRDMVYRGEDRDRDFDCCHALTVHGSCDGLVLLSYYGAFVVWNPITRQYALLPSMDYDKDDVAGFYRHAASGEYRVLYRQGRRLERDYYVLTLGSQQQQTRNIGRHPSPPWVYEHIHRAMHGACVWPPVLLHGSLHCPPPHRIAGDILVFDTDAESFGHIPSPQAAKDELYRLFEMEGKLAMFCWMKNTWISDLWLMEDYEKAIWVRKYRIELSPSMHKEDSMWMWDPPIVYKEGDMLLENGWQNVLHYDKKGRQQGVLDL